MTTSFTKYYWHILNSSLFALFVFFSSVSIAFAADRVFVPLTGIPGITDLGKASIVEYINALYIFTIGLGALIGVVKISIAGVKYSLDEIVTKKQEAKEDIKGVLLGLAILLIPFIVLNTIYPDLTNLNVFENAPKVTLKGATPSTGGTGGRIENDREYKTCLYGHTDPDVGGVPSSDLGTACKIECEAQPGGRWFPGVVYRNGEITRDDSKDEGVCSTKKPLEMCNPEVPNAAIVITPPAFLERSAFSQQCLTMGGQVFENTTAVAPKIRLECFVSLCDT